MDEIRCDEESYLIWKWHPAGVEQGTGDRENAIRWGSSLRVKDGEVAVFVYKQKDGTLQDFIVGPYDQTIKTSNLPVLASIVGLAYEGGTPFPAEVYFINLAQIIQVKFAVPFFDVYDPRFLDFGVPVAVRGTITFNLDDFQKQIRDAVARYAKHIVTNAPTENNIPVINLESKISQINEALEHDVMERLKENFGVTVSSLDIAAIEIDKSSQGYRQLMLVTKDVTTAKIQAETTDYVERIRIQREEGQYAQHKQTQAANLGAFQVEKQSEVGIAGADALGQMGANGSGTVSLGGDAGFNPAAMMAGMAVGGAVGQNIAGTMNNMMAGNSQQQAVVSPPPIPTTDYHIAVNGQASGPYDRNTLTQMSLSEQFLSSTLVWKPGMAEWMRADTVDDLKGLFMPSVPPVE